VNDVGALSERQIARLMEAKDLTEICKSDEKQIHE
jgi:hypothetical protein